jgi:uncharacterized protein YprB with RNaseH-like and TPR domain
MSNKSQRPRVLFLDIETRPLLAYVWKIWDENIGLNQIKEDWHVISWAAKWMGDPDSKIMQMDQRKVKDKENDKVILQGIWDLLNEADIVVTQNGRKFDNKKLNARFAVHKMQPPSTFKHIDIFVLAKRYFGFISYKLEYLAQIFCTKYKKLVDRKYSGFNLWKECLNNNQDAWREMALYNKYDVFVLEEIYHNIIPWDNSINFNVYSNSLVNICKCGSKSFKKNGFAYTNSAMYQRYKCTKCGSEMRDRTNLLSKDKKKSLQSHTVR